MRLRLEFAAAWEEALWRAARAWIGARHLGEGALAEAIASVSRRYTTERATLGGARDGEGERAARLLFFAVADALKVHLPLAELAASGALAARQRPLRVVDVGAGVGGSAIGVATWLAGAGLRAELHLVDRDAEGLALAGAALAELGLESVTAVRTSVADVTVSLPEAEADLLVAGNALNEIASPMRERVAAALVSRTSVGGALVVLEPALRETARGLQRLRDRLLASTDATVVGPCTHARPCPMLAGERDWCIEDRAWDPPPRFARMRAIVGLRREGLKFAYLALRRGEAAAARAGRLRVVSEPLISKGKRELFLCGSEGLLRARLLRRHESNANHEVATARRGDVIEVTPALPVAGDPRAVDVPSDAQARRE